VKEWNLWGEDRWLVRQGYQRHLLQVGYTDAVIGRLLDRLESTGLFDRALVVVVADHGVSFEAGGSRRWVTAENIADIARVPLFLKLPGQRSGDVDLRSVRTIDILPTIADVLDTKLPWPVDGRSLLEGTTRSTTVSVAGREGKSVRASVEKVDRDQAETVRRNVHWFGEGDDSLFAIGEHRDLLGRSLRELRVRPSIAARIRFANEGLFADVRTSSRFVPARITGTVEGVEIALAINGRITALTRTFRDQGKLRFSALVPETSFRKGFNQVELLAIEGTRTTMRLVHLGENDSA
jgi:hypothetical protein